MYMVIIMQYFNFDLNNTVKVAVFGREHLIPPRLHRERTTDFYILYFVTEGRLSLKVNEEDVVLNRGDIYIFDKGTYQKPVAAEECEYYFVHFDGAGEVGDSVFLEQVHKQNIDFIKSNPYGFSRFDNFKVSFLKRICIEDKSTFEFLHDTFKRNLTPSGESSIKESFKAGSSFVDILFLLEKLSENSLSDKTQQRHPYNNVKRIADYINEKYKEDIDSSVIESKFSINYDYANRIFKQFFGYSINRYRNKRRIDIAKFLLLTTDKSIGEIAVEVGFEDKYYFSRLFSKLEGISPANYRNK